MAGRYLLDSNIVIALFNRDADVTRRLAETEEVFLSTIVLGELIYGALYSSLVEENLAKIDFLAVRLPPLPVDPAIAREYGRIKQELRDRGTPIPENDIWIAATAIRHELILATRDAHFNAIPCLSWEMW